MPRYKRTGDKHYYGTISVNLPVEVIHYIDRYKERCGDNRSLALEYIVRDWKRFIEDKQQERVE